MNMKIAELKERKKELGYSNKMISDISGVPLSTVQKVFGGSTETPRYATLLKIAKALEPSAKERFGNSDYFYEAGGGYTYDYVNEALEEYSVSAFYGYDEKLSIGKKKQGEYTVDDADALPEGVRMELINGVLYDMGSPDIFHQTIITEVYSQISSVLKSSKGDCAVFVAPMDVCFDLEDKKDRPQPDLLVACDKHKYLNETGRILGVPDMVMEVVSTSSRSKDRVVKLNKYLEKGVREYWIVDPAFQEILAYNFSGRPFLKRYTFNDTIPLNIFGGKVSVDFKAITDYLCDQFGFEPK